MRGCSEIDKLTISTTGIDNYRLSFSFTAQNNYKELLNIFIEVLRKIIERIVKLRISGADADGIYSWMYAVKV